MIHLASGNPWNNSGLGYHKPATFSRFIVPFSYRLQQIHKTAKTESKKILRFENVPTKQFANEKIRYFTSETAEVLYGRAIWAQIPKEIWEQNNPKRCGPFCFRAQKSHNCLMVALSQPWIILFEGEQHDDGYHDVLQHGFLVLEAYLEPENNMLFIDDLLEFNELFRFTSCPYQDHTNTAGYVKAMGDFPSDYRDCSKIKNYSPDDPFALYKKRWLSLLGIPLLKNGNWYSIVSDISLKDEKKNDHFCRLSHDINKCFIYVDNRAFVWTCAILENGAKTLSEEYSTDIRKPWEFGHWLRLLNVDQPALTPEKSHLEITQFEKEWLKRRTYDRWVETGTYYGFCYHSGAMLGSPVEQPPLWYHFGHIYFDQILLLFYLRITLFAFSRRLTCINNDNDQKALLKNFKILRRSFAKFTNLYQFPLISNQQQGIEMYDIARKHMDIEGLFKDVKDEVTSTHEFLEMRASSRLDSKANLLAVIGIIITLLLAVSPEKRSTIMGRVQNDTSYLPMVIDALLLVFAGWLFRYKIANLFKRIVNKFWI